MFDVNYFVSLYEQDNEVQNPMGYSFVTNQLAQGSAPPPDLPLPFDVLVLAAQEYQPVFTHIDVLSAPIDDAVPSKEEVRRVLDAGHRVALALKRGKRVLVTCYQGRNRSGLINGLALIELGWTSLDAIKAIRHARGPTALSNMAFQSVLHAHAKSRGRESRARLA